MKPGLHPSPILFPFTVILASVIRFPGILCQNTRPYDVCGQKVECGDIDLEYPFWGAGRPSYCGHPGFQLTCQSNLPELLYESVNYRVLDTDTSAQMIKVARNDLWTTAFCPRYLYNTTYNSTLFNGDDFNQENVSLYYGCNTSVLVTAQPLGNSYKFGCNVNDTPSASYFLTANSVVPAVSDFLVQCENHIDVPVNQTSANILGSTNATRDDLRSALISGFNLQWMVFTNECDDCIRSNGRCGSNSTSPELFVCYCASGNFSRTCEGGFLEVVSIHCPIVSIPIPRLLPITYPASSLMDDLKRQVQQLQEELARVKVVNEEDQFHDEDSNGDDGYYNPFGSSSASDSVDIPEFDGKIQPDEFLDWLHTVVKVFDFKEVSEERKVKLVAIKLRKHAGLWWENLKSRSNVVLLQPYWTYADVCKLAVKVEKQQKEKRGSYTRLFNKEDSTSSGKTSETIPKEMLEFQTGYVLVVVEESRSGIVEHNPLVRKILEEFKDKIDASYPTDNGYAVYDTS
ncbi:hypothetical protein CTI12_AA139760 [Artemisia annua]|uniref:non-specific serine/threonine protein kinase n=1 Tax=Artemisia annua TaxID=35608 RepID=A0A2U1PLL6_ARTAN|nr:hypothetical protein CTI12_AA139760 [Artemisia annua]